MFVTYHTVSGEMHHLWTGHSEENVSLLELSASEAGSLARPLVICRFSFQKTPSFTKMVATR